KSKTAEKIFDGMRTLAADVGIPDGLRKMGVQKEDLPELARQALKDIAGFTNPRQGTEEDMIDIYKSAM
ncbi:MAG: iron-containing alcohol dehydrogenase, partial [Bacillota bacterium]